MFTRDIVKMQRWTGAWLSAKEESYRSVRKASFLSYILKAEKSGNPQPVSIIFPSDFWPVSNKAQMDLVDRFVEDLESSHGVKKTQLLIKDLWKETAPSEADNGDVEHYLKDVSMPLHHYTVKLICVRWALHPSATACITSWTNSVKITKSDIPRNLMSILSCAGDGSYTQVF
jgi:hypothetical protein